MLNQTLGQHTENHLNDSVDKHEIKMNIFNLGVLRSVDVGYEYLINENASFGCSMYVRFDRAEEIKGEPYFRLEIDNNRSFSLTPYFRRYFSKKYASRFFIEGFGMLNSGKTADIEYVYFEPEPSQNSIESKEIKSIETYTDFALGISLGGKIVKKKGFLIEFYTGVGLNMKAVFIYAVTRGGFSLGYRF